MSYIKQNWAEMQAGEIPVEAKHLEHVEKGLADVIDKVGSVVTQETITWHDSTFEIPKNEKFLITAVDQIPLEENRAYKVILTDLEGTEAAYELSLIESESLGTTAGYKSLYYGDFHLGGNSGFALIQDGIGVRKDLSIEAAPGKTGITLAGYKKVVIEKTHFTTEVKKSIEQNEEYARVSQTDFDCTDENSSAFLKNKPFGKSSKIITYTDLPLVEPVDPEQPWISTDITLNINSEKPYSLQIVNPQDESILIEVPLKYYTIKELVSEKDLEKISKNLLGCPVLCLEEGDSNLPLIYCGFDPVTSSAIEGTSYFILEGLVGMCYRIDGTIETKIATYKKIPAIYQESPDFEETDINSGTYIKNLPLRVSFSNEILFEDDKVSISKYGSTQSSYSVNFNPTLSKPYKITINDIQFSASCIVNTLNIAGYILKCYYLACPLGAFYIFNKEFLMESGLYTAEDATNADGILIIQLNDSFKDTTVSIKIQGPKASYKKLNNKYLPSLLVAPDSKNDIQIDYIAGDYYFSTPNNQTGGAISEKLDFSNLSLKSNSIINASFDNKLSVDIVHTSNDLLTNEDQDYFLGKYLIASEQSFDGDYGYFEYCAPILTAIDDGYLYVLPSIPKVFKLDSQGIKTFYDLAKYEPTWKEFFSRLSSFDTVKITHGIYYSRYNWYDRIDIIGIPESNIRKGCILTITGLDDEKSAFCTFTDNYDCIEALDYGTGHPRLAVNQFTGKIYINKNDYINSLVSSTKYLTYDLRYANSKYYQLFPKNTTGTNLCTVTEVAGHRFAESYCYRYLDDTGIEHWYTNELGTYATDYTGISNVKHTNYISLKYSYLPFKEFDYKMGNEFLTYTEEGNLITRNTEGKILATYPVKGPKIKIDNNSISQWHLIIGKNCLFLINNMLRERIWTWGERRWQTNIYRIDRINNEFVLTNLDMKFTPSMSLQDDEQRLVAAPRVLGNYLFLPTEFGRDSQTQAKYLFYMPLYKTEANIIKSLNKQLDELKESIEISWDTLFIFDGGDADCQVAVLDDTKLQ